MAINQTGVRNAYTVPVIDEAEETSGVEEYEACDAAVAMEFANGLREYRPAQFSLLDQPLGFRKPACIARRPPSYLHGVDHAITVKEVMASDWLEEWVGTVPDIDSVDAFRYFSSDREGVTDGLFRHRSEVPCNLDTWIGRFRKWDLALSCNQRIFHHIQCHSSCSLEQIPWRRRITLRMRWRCQCRRKKGVLPVNDGCCLLWEMTQGR
ncbi:hypothetical protein Ancab_019035 [Ancistrocladus abbreviatus]